MTLTIEVPTAVVEQINRVNDLCNSKLAKTGRVDVRELAPVVGRDARSLYNAMECGHFPMGWISSETKRDSTLPVSKVWSWFMAEFMQLHRVQFVMDTEGEPHDAKDAVQCDSN